MVVRFCFVVLLSVIAHCGWGQSFDFGPVERLSALINSEAEEAMPLLSADGQKLYFTRFMYSGNMGGKYSGHDVWISDMGPGGWKRADNTKGTFNDRGNNAVIGVNRDGKTLYLMDASSSQRLNGIYFSKLINSYWTRPEFIPIPGIANQDFVGMYISPDFDVIFISMKGADSRGEEDIYVSVKDVTGAWSIPKNIGSSINTSGFEISPFLSHDKKRLYFSSNGHKGQGDADIFYSERLYNSWETWSSPINLGQQINSDKFDAYFSIYGDSVAYWASNRDSNLADIYKVKVSIGVDILARNQRYLSTAEIDALIGKNILRKMTFEKKSTALSPAQKELLFYIVNKVLLKKEVGFHLVVLEEENAQLSQARLNAIYDHLRQAGVDGTRIYTDQKPGFVKTSKNNTGAIELWLFE
ncbi:MAG: hypothetical protein ACOYXT_06215 [Bacteroidota bacterium]